MVSLDEAEFIEQVRSASPRNRPGTAEMLRVAQAVGSRLSVVGFDQVELGGHRISLASRPAFSIGRLTTAHYVREGEKLVSPLNMVPREVTDHRGRRTATFWVSSHTQRALVHTIRTGADYALVAGDDNSVKQVVSLGSDHEYRLQADSLTLHEGDHANPLGVMDVATVAALRGYSDYLVGREAVISLDEDSLSPDDAFVALDLLAQAVQALGSRPRPTS